MFCTIKTGVPGGRRPQRGLKSDGFRDQLRHLALQLRRLTLFWRRLGFMALGGWVWLRPSFFPTPFFPHLLPLRSFPVPVCTAAARLRFPLGPPVPRSVAAPRLSFPAPFWLRPRSRRWRTTFKPKEPEGNQNETKRSSKKQKRNRKGTNMKPNGGQRNAEEANGAPKETNGGPKGN